MGIWYKDHYLTTPAAQARLAAVLEDPDIGLEARADLERRLGELRQIRDNRCHISRDQRHFLERVLSHAPGQ